MKLNEANEYKERLKAALDRNDHNGWRRFEAIIKEIQANAIEWAGKHNAEINQRTAALRGHPVTETPVNARYYWRADQWFVHVPKCPKCGGEWKFYDGALGYESYQCRRCRFDFKEIQVYVGIPKDIDSPPTTK